MNIRKSLLAIALAASLAGVGATAQAQWVVIDPAEIQSNMLNHAQDIAKYVQMVQQMQSQLQQLQQTYAQLQTQYKSITGSRGLGMIDNENYTQNIPTNWQQTLQAMQNGGHVGQLANQISREASELQQPYFRNVGSMVTTALSANMKQSATGQALNAQMYDESGARFQSIQQLMQQINNTTDLKGVAEIQARLEAENAQLLNELIRLQAMNGMIGQQQKIQAQHLQQQQYQFYHASY